MTHFIAAVAVPSNIPAEFTTTPTRWPELYGADHRENEPSEALANYLSRALARFDENREVERWTAKADIIAEGRAGIERYRDTTYAEWLKLGEAAYRTAHPHAVDAHFDYLREGFPKKLEWTDEEIYADAINEWDEVNDDGDRRDTDNPDARWDWWVIGGRWEEDYRDRQGESAADVLASLIETHALIAAGGTTRPTPPDGKQLENPERRLAWWFPRGLVVEQGDTFEWIAQGEEGWFGMATDVMTEDEWIAHLIATVEKLDPATRFVYIDFHI
ncbi:MAG: hypothetical protein LBE05_05910 [Microbacterium sp.]|nr:hypothetical protein [Microbacterium sp.]